MRYLLFISFCFLFNIELFCQIQDSSLLAGVTIYDTSKHVTFSISNGLDIAENPNYQINQLGIFLKQYGSGQLASLSLKGLGTTYTPILWNGIILQNPLNGTIDCSLLPPSHQLSLRNQQSTPNGLTGSILEFNAFRNSTSYSHLNIEGKLGSFGTFGANSSVFLVGKKYRIELNSHYDQAKNNFAYHSPLLPPGSPAVRQQHAEEQKFQILGGAEIVLPHQKELHIHFWYLNADRNIPPSFASMQSTADIKDQNVRCLLSYKKSGISQYWNITTGLLHEQIVYNNPVTNIYGNHKSIRIPVRLEKFLQMNDLNAISLIGNFDHSVAYSTHLGDVSKNQIGTVTDQILHISGKWTYRKSNRLLQSSLQFGSRFDKKQEIGGSILLGINHTSWNFQLELSRKFRFPSLNDLYWVPDGNPELVPESGWNIQSFITWKQAHWQIQCNPFWNNYHQLIQWKPQSSGQFKPINVNHVSAVGTIISCTHDCAFRSSHVSTSMNSQLQYAVQHENGTSIPLQYTPTWMVSLHHEWKFKDRYSISAQPHYTSQVRTGIEESNLLVAYFLLDAQCNYLIPFKKFELQFSLSARNLLNVEYQTYVNYPMPNRFFQLSLQIKNMKL